MLSGQAGTVQSLLLYTSRISETIRRKWGGSMSLLVTTEIIFSHQCLSRDQSNGGNSIYDLPCQLVQFCYNSEGLSGHQSGHQLVTPQFLFTFSSPSTSSSNSNSNLSSPFAAPSTCSSRSSANPTPCIELRSLPVPRGRGLGRPSVAERTIEARISIEGGKEGLL